MKDKKEFYKELTKEQQEFVEFLIDNAYCKGYNDGEADEKFVEHY